jgi:tRNA threonylcarbamoyladenosine modification (KEOPS) complex  Pcc1 subunit
MQMAEEEKDCNNTIATSSPARPSQILENFSLKVTHIHVQAVDMVSFRQSIKSDLRHNTD